MNMKLENALMDTLEICARFEMTGTFDPEAESAQSAHPRVSI